MTPATLRSSRRRTRRRILKLVTGLVVAAGIALSIHIILKARRVDTRQLQKAFTEAPAEARAHVKSVVASVRAAEWFAAVTELKAMTEGVTLTADQRGAISSVLSDIEGMPGARSSTNAEAIIEIIYELQPKLTE